MLGPYAVVRGTGGTTWADTAGGNAGFELPTGGRRLIIGIGRCQVTIGEEEHVRLLARLHEACDTAETMEELFESLPEPWRTDTTEWVESLDRPIALRNVVSSVREDSDWLNQTMLGIVPDDIIHKYGELGASGSDGPCVILRNEHFDAIVQEMRECGFDVAVDHALIRRADQSSLSDYDDEPIPGD